MTAPKVRSENLSSMVPDRLRSIPAPGRLEKTVTSRRADIVDACIAELREHGFQRMKVESVARRAGIDKRTLYDYIQRKEDLLLLVFGHYLPRMLDRIRQARDGAIDPREQLSAMLHMHTETVNENPHFVLFLYRELRYLPKDDQAAVLALINDIHLEYTRVFTVLNRECATLPTAEAELNASSALAMIDMIGLYRPHMANRRPEEIADHIQRTLLGSATIHSEQSAP